MISSGGNYTLYDLQHHRSGGGGVAYAPTNIYYYSEPEATQYEVQDVAIKLPEPDSVLFSTSSLEESGVHRQIYNLIANKQIDLPRGNYMFLQPYENEGTLNVNNEKGELYLTYGTKYTIGGRVFDNTRTEVVASELKTDELLIEVDGRFISPGDQTMEGIFVNTKGRVNLFRRSGNIFLENHKNVSEDSVWGWAEGDCYAHNDNKEVFFSTNKKGVAILRATGNHNACVYTTFDLKANTPYQLSFDYNSSLGKQNAYIQLESEEVITFSQEGEVNEWERASYVFSTDKDEEATVYLYSGMDKKEALMLYRDLSLNFYHQDKALDLSVQQEPLEIYVNEDKTPFILHGESFSLLPVEAGFWNTTYCSSCEGDQDAQKGESFVLESDPNEAYVFRKIIVSPHSVYRLSFDYRAEKHDGAIARISFDTGSEEILLGPGGATESWQKISKDISVPTGAKEMTIFFLSSKKEYGNTRSQWKDLSINHYSRSLKGNLLAESKSIGGVELKPERLETNKISPTMYRVSVQAAPSSFWLYFAQSFHKGWNIYPDSVRQHSFFGLFGPSLKFNHLEANGFANAWKVDTRDLCKRTEKCVRNSDGTYDLDFIIAFTPQRYILIGVFVSLMVIITVSILAFIKPLKSEEER